MLNFPELTNVVIPQQNNVHNFRNNVVDLTNFAVQSDKLSQTTVRLAPRAAILALCRA
jgi:hypothetical protein